MSRSGRGARGAHYVGLARTLPVGRALVAHLTCGPAQVAGTGGTAGIDVVASGLGEKKTNAAQ